MGMIHTQRMLLCSDVISEHQIQFVISIPAAGNGRNCVVGNTLGFRKDKGRFIGITTPGAQNFICQFCNSFPVGTIQTDDAHGPSYNPSAYILEPPKKDFLLNGRTLHRKAIMSTLKMLMAQNTATYNWKIGIGTDKVVWEDSNKVK